MEPVIQYVETVDGVRIAYWTVGEGEPFVYMSGWPFEHAELEWQNHDTHLVFEHLAQNNMFVRFDGRGCGLSDRDVADISLNARVLDLVAVLSKLPPGPVNLGAFATSSPVAIVFAARHPERVKRLVLFDAFAEMTSIAASPQTQAFNALLKADWKTFTETLANLGYGWGMGERASRYAAYIRECVTQDMMMRAIDQMSKIDVRHLLPALTMPVLVLQHLEVPYDGERQAHFIANNLRNATLMILEGNYGSNPIAERGPIGEFLGAPPLDTKLERLVTVMFTDIAESTAMTQTLGDEAAHEFVRKHDAIVGDALRENFGQAVKHTGDGIMASFMSPRRALDCAIQIQREVAQYNVGSERPLRLRIGLNAGEPVIENDDMFGSVVQLARRVCDTAQPQQILITDAVRDLVDGSDIRLADAGEVELRGFPEPVRLYELQWAVG